MTLHLSLVIPPEETIMPINYRRYVVKHPKKGYLGNKNNWVSTIIKALLFHTENDFYTPAQKNITQITGAKVIPVEITIEELEDG